MTNKYLKTMLLGFTTTSSPVKPPRQKRHNSSPSPILKNSPNRNNNYKFTTTRQSPEVTFKRNYLTPKELDRSFEYYEYERQNERQNLNRSTGSSDVFTDGSLKSASPYSRLTSPSLINFHYVRPSRSSTPTFQATTRSLSTGSRQPIIHHIKVEIEPEALDFKRSLKKACSEDLKDSRDKKDSRDIKDSRGNKDSNKDVNDRYELKLGDFVWVDSSIGLLSGKLRYLGPTEFKFGHWAGVELELPYGKHDGKVEGKR